jgi:hypothetical protein
MESLREITFNGELMNAVALKTIKFTGRRQLIEADDEWTCSILKTNSLEYPFLCYAVRNNSSKFVDGYKTYSGAWKKQKRRYMRLSLK